MASRGGNLFRNCLRDKTALLMTAVILRWPTDVADFLPQTVPQVNFRPVASVATFSNISNLTQQTWLTSFQVPVDTLSYLKSDYGRPNSTGFSRAPITLVVVPKANNTVDAFYFTFWAFNEGQK